MRRGLENLRSTGLLEGEDEMAAIPERLGPYRLDKVIGCGGMGIVYLARDDKGEHAVKFLRPSLTVFPEARRRFLREVRAMSQLGHPNIVAVHDPDLPSKITENGAALRSVPFRCGWMSVSNLRCGDFTWFRRPGTPNRAFLMTMSYL